MRHEWIAHRSVKATIQAEPPAGLKYELIDEMLADLRDYMNAIKLHYNESQYAYEHFIMNADADSLVSMLKYGLRAIDLMREGKIGWEDLHAGEWKDA